MALYLLDTNILSDLIRNPSGIVTQKIIAVGEKAVATSIIVAAELRFGAQKRGSPRLSAQVDAVLAAIVILPWEAPADLHYASIRAALESQGTTIGANDLLIAAHALALSRVLVTDNVGEFARVDGLGVENWLS
jgi:tRNA(fMet)-specific endonuclease VapC